MRTIRLARTTLVLLLVLVMLAMSGTGHVLAAKGDKKDRGDKPGPAEGRPDATVVAPIAVIDGDRFKMAQARMADRLYLVRDARQDQVLLDGTPAGAGEGWSDIATVHLAPVKVPAKLLSQMDDDYPRGAVGAFYGADADWREADRALFVAVELAEKRAAGTVQQVEVGLDGDAAAPLQAGASSDTRAGLERFSLSGTFSNGSESSGTTDVSGRGPGDPIEFYNATSGVFGYYDARQRTYFLIMPLPGDATAASVALRTMTPAGEVVDRLELPGGGHLVPLADPALGWDPAEGTPPLACRSLETFSVASGQPGLEPGATRLRYTAGVDPSLGPAQAEAVLALLGESGTTVSLTARAVGADGERGEALPVDATVSRARGLNAFTLTLDLPAGTWTLETTGEGALLTPAGEPLVDVSSLIGRAGVRTGDRLDGFVAGDPGCARFDLGAEPCDMVSADGMAKMVGIGSSEVEQQSVRRPDGSRWCVGRATANDEVQYIARFGTSYLTSEDLAREVAAAGCPVTPGELGAESVVLDCGEQGYERHLVRVLPRSIEDRDADGGLLLSVDMLVDGSRPLGERYDGATAATVFEDLVGVVAASAVPAGLAGSAAADGAAAGDAATEAGSSPAPAMPGASEG